MIETIIMLMLGVIVVYLPRVVIVLDVIKEEAREIRSTLQANRIDNIIKP